MPQNARIAELEEQIRILAAKVAEKTVAPSAAVPPFPPVRYLGRPINESC